jgi:hypothetical protein
MAVDHAVDADWRENERRALAGALATFTAVGGGGE